ncbi:hypothetical protein HPB52_015579 [Rhipicephalus sanguineus]|uniref:Methyltransferase type 12 domain-containing protein n=1 Tax=Rhipicephalus sanguineus TaxID=34632 RepID=A0A9D4PKS3_RHISA|nr:hypothetical protein HPB52_015579 [Rhipicephalus sanguineus]
MSSSPILDNEAANSEDHQTETIEEGLDPVSFTYLKANMYREHQNVLEKVKFRQQQGDDWRYLDLGCGPGNFLKEILLPRLRPCKCVVAVDSSRQMLSYAQQHHDAHEVFFELLDIEHGNPNEIVAKYGQFDRVYAFLIFHFVKDLNQAYRNVYQLLRQGGECLAVNFMRTGISDVWHQIYEKEAWKEYVPNPVEVLSKRFCFNEEVPHKALVTDEMNAVAAAGLDIVDCHTYTSQWIFPTADAWLGK